MNVIRALLTTLAFSTTASAATYYTVQPGDSLATVAQKANMEPATVLKLNGLTSTTLQVGQKLNLTPSAFAKAAPAKAQATVTTPTAAPTAPQTVVNAPKTPATSAKPVAKTSTAPVVTPSGSSAYIRSAANRFLGIRYVLGGTGGRGIDCSGYTLQVFRTLGINLPRTAYAQWRSGVAVSSRNLRAGDLVFFNTTGRTASHVGIYLGNGMMANANSYQGRTVIEPLFSNKYWASRYIGARRVLS
ncbi:C40 family peptidase [Deinococcus fonticola]|uniref:C40 family peptidase n=1 Tax=Deinococcus fonticola TaxID=2528713 RepID=UPI001074A2EE|nr:C40 family peptidase [Deinococcus fonticola]